MSQADDDKTRTQVPLTSGTMVSHYRIIERIGAGGMGEVYLAADTKLDRNVALKFLPPHLCQDADCRARFKREAQAAAKLDHPNIVAVHEVGEFQGRPYFSMQHVEGQSLKEVIAGKTLPIERIIDIGIQICDGLQAAHEKGITHRDIKPSNILIDSHGRARIVDLGLASVMGSDHLTKTGSTLGTIGYMSPEQVRGETVDRRTDLFSFGVVLYEMITGHAPFNCDSEAATLHAITDTKPELLARFRREIPAELQIIVDKALEKNVATRYQHADDLQADLVRVRESVTTVSTSRAVSSRKIRWVGLVAVLLMIVATAIQLIFRPWSSTRTGQADKIMLAVLPFENLGPAEQGYFSDGITEEIITKLTKVGGLGIISRTSAMTYKNTRKSLRQIGSELGVGYVLEGTIRWEKEADVDRVRINPQLIRVKDDSHVWAETYDRALTEVFAVQTEIAQQVVAALDITLSGSDKFVSATKPTNDLTAYDYYLRGKNYVKYGGPKGWVLAQTMFERAVALDSGFALCWAELSINHMFAYWFFKDHTSKRREQGRVCAERALNLDPGLPEASWATGFYYYWGSRDYDHALIEFRRALDLRPNDAVSLYFLSLVQRRLGNWADCLRNQEIAAALDPRNTDVLDELPVTYGYLRHYQEASRWAQRCLELNPDDAFSAIAKVYICLQAEGDVSKAEALADSVPWRNYVPGVDPWSAEQVALGMLAKFRGQVLARIVCETPGDSLARYLIGMLPYRPASETAAERVQRIACADSARAVITRYLEDLPEDPVFHALLGVTLAISGQCDRAVREGEWAARALPVTKDAISGANVLGSLAVIYVLAEDDDAAVDQLDKLLSIPSNLSVALLRVDPTWEPLRSNPRFQKLLEKYGT